MADSATFAVFGSRWHPLGANRAYPFLGELALGREPSLH
jgi:hypothetical protein